MFNTGDNKVMNNNSKNQEQTQKTLSPNAVAPQKSGMFEGSSNPNSLFGGSKPETQPSLFGGQTKIGTGSLFGGEK